MTLFYDTVGPTATGAAVARASVDATYRVPAKARELVGIRPFIQIEQPNAGDSILAVWDIKGNDYRFQPCEGLFPVGNGKLGAIDQMATTPMETWLIHAPLNGNETLDIGCEPCSAMAVNGQAGMTMIFSTVRTGRPTIYGKASREVTGPSTAATDTAGTDLRVDNGIKMAELWGVATIGTATVVADEEFAGYFTMRCTGWEGPQETKFFHAPMHAIEATTGVNRIESIMRLPFDARFKSKQATVHTNHYNFDALSVAGILAHGIRWIGS